MFDQIFNEAKENVYVFENTTKDMLNTLPDGVVFLKASELYQRVHKLRSDGQTYNIAVAYEVYNEVVPRPAAPQRVVARCAGRSDKEHCLAHHAKSMLNLTVNKGQEAGFFFKLLFKGNMNRTQHATDSNAESSRLHAIF
ncbi:hypothetical protein HPB49_023308 [Dermacentor silvarum]|uniref:Uncharacterized protein n=1 Tax=Dermacentor silvarum TaxID=543639 RepID=A0ACB8E3N2_DERSI|nr:hypothetical protein HPB49_023308 [Dermacentor silvarum]